MLSTVLTKTVRDGWRAVAIAAVSLTVLLAIVMAAYQQYEVSFYYDLPEVFRSFVNIPDGTDVAGLSIGVLYGIPGAWTLAGLAIAMGSSSIAGEERAGTLGLLLGNPVSRSRVLAHKAGSMVLLSAVAVAALWIAAHGVAALLGVELGELRLAPYGLHLLANTLLYGALAMALGAWTGNRELASGASAAVLLIGFVAAGLLQLVDGLENLAKIFPWYYFDTATPMINGVNWGHASVLLGSSAALAALALVGVNRRDLKSQSTGVTLTDRLRTSRWTRKIVDKITSSTRASRIWIKTASEHQGLLLITTSLMFLMMGILMGPIYGLMDESLLSLSANIPEDMYAFVGSASGDISTPEGFYQFQTFGMIAPIATGAVAVVLGSQAVAAEEANRTIGLLLANPITRSRVLLEKTLAMGMYSLAVGIATCLGVWLGSLLGSLGMSLANIAATSLLATMVGLVFGALSLAIGAATGNTRIAASVTAGLAFAAYLTNSLGILNSTLAGLAKATPFHYYLTSDPLNNGIHWGHAATLVGAATVLIAAAVVLFNRRDLRQNA